MSSQFHVIRRAQNLEGQLGRLNSQVGRLRSEAKTSAATSSVPIWEVVRFDPVAALAGSDWDPLFDDEGANNRIEHSLHTSGGEVAHVNCDNCATRLRIRFTGQGEGQLLMKLAMSGSGSIQVKCNGDVTTYSSGAFISIPLVSPPLTNEVVVSADGTGGAFQFSLDGLLFDGVHRKWVGY